MAFIFRRLTLSSGRVAAAAKHLARHDAFTSLKWMSTNDDKKDNSQVVFGSGVERDWALAKGRGFNPREFMRDFLLNSGDGSVADLPPTQAAEDDATLEDEIMAETFYDPKQVVFHSMEEQARFIKNILMRVLLVLPEENPKSSYNTLVSIFNEIGIKKNMGMEKADEEDFKLVGVFRGDDLRGYLQVAPQVGEEILALDDLEKEIISKLLMVVSKCTELVFDPEVVHKQFEKDLSIRFYPDADGYASRFNHTWLKKQSEAMKLLHDDVLPKLLSEEDGCVIADIVRKFLSQAFLSQAEVGACDGSDEGSEKK